MKYWKNAANDNRSVPVTNVKSAQSLGKPIEIGSNWIEITKAEFEQLTSNDHLFTQNSVRYFGRL